MLGGSSVGAWTCVLRCTCRYGLSGFCPILGLGEDFMDSRWQPSTAHPSSACPSAASQPPPPHCLAAPKTPCLSLQGPKWCDVPLFGDGRSQAGDAVGGGTVMPEGLVLVQIPAFCCVHLWTSTFEDAQASCADGAWTNEGNKGKLLACT